MTDAPNTQGPPAMPPTPAGMYADPDRPGQMRYWDGRSWAPSGAGMPAPASKPLWKRWWFIGAMAFLLLGVIGVATGSGDTNQVTNVGAAGQVAVPDLVGQNGGAVQPALAAAGLALGAVSYSPADIPKDQVVSQDPAAGASVPSGSPVAVVISVGPATAAAPPAPIEPAAPVEAAPAPEPAEPAPAPEPEPAAPKLTVSQENAIAKANSYLELTAFSKKGLIKQLAFEGFSDADATFAVNSISVNWNEQAAKKAQSYLDLTSFSRAGLIKQLEFEGFTTAQAKFGASEVGL